MPDGQNLFQKLSTEKIKTGFKLETNNSSDSREIIFTNDNLVEKEDNYLKFTETIEPGIQVTAEFALDERTGVVKRKDKIINLSSEKRIVFNPIIVYSTSDKKSRVTVMHNTWCHESQLESRSIKDIDNLTFGSRGRSCSGYAPYFTVAEAKDESNEKLIFNLLPCGDWRTSISKIEDDRGSRLMIEIDRYQEDVKLELEPEAEYELQLDSLLQTANDIRKAGADLQRYAYKNLKKLDYKSLPVVYNTWFDNFHYLSLEGLEKQLETAATIGCEVFVIDAGWYGLIKEDWSDVGDWREKTEVFQPGSLSEFADTVRDRGLDFGIWMEPERVYKEVPVRREHPEWFLKGEGDYFYPDLMQQEAYNWLYSEITGVIEKYQVRWIKLDCNFDFGEDPYQKGHQGRMQAWYQLLEELAHEFPDLTIEGCASGGLRNDLLTAGHFHTHFLSDTVDPVDIIRIGEASCCRLTPSMMYRWAVVYPIGDGFTPYGNKPRDTDDLVLSPRVATSKKVSSYYLGFVLKASMTGVLGLSGNIAGLKSNHKQQLKDYISFYKKHREFIQNAVAIPLTPIKPITERSGVAMMQLTSAAEDEEFKKNMIFVYNVLEPSDTNTENITVKPAGLPLDKKFTVKDDKGNLLIEGVTGEELCNDGMGIEIAEGKAVILMINEEK